MVRRATEVGPENLPAKTDWERLNELIDWYTRFKPSAGSVIKVKFTEKQLDKRCVRVEGQQDRWHYKDRILERVRD